MRAQSVSALVVVVPVHDEAELLGRCLTALGVAVWTARRKGLRCVVRIVLDDCSDDSALIAARHPFMVVRSDAGVVGAARARGVDAALRELGGVPAHRMWIANTDADSAVPANWLTLQADLAAASADVVLGTVRPDFTDLSPEYRENWLRTHVPGEPAGNVHGANLGIRAETYAAAGGFAHVPQHEDVMLVDQSRRLGARIVASDAAEVATSARTVGRTPGGYAAFIRDKERSLAVGRGQA